MWCIYVQSMMRSMWRRKKRKPHMPPFLPYYYPFYLWDGIWLLLSPEMCVKQWLGFGDATLIYSCSYSLYHSCSMWLVSLLLGRHVQAGVWSALIGPGSWLAEMHDWLELVYESLCSCAAISQHTRLCILFLLYHNRIWLWWHHGCIYQ